MDWGVKRGEGMGQGEWVADWGAGQSKRPQADFARGTFRVRGDVIDIFPAHYEDRAWRVNLFGDTVENIEEFDPLTGHKQDDLEFIKIYANSHYVTPRPTLVQAIKSINSDLKLRLEEWDMMRPQSVAVSATPSGWELNESGGVFVEQVIRPTGLIDPPVHIRPARTQVDDLVGEVRATANAGYRSLVTVLTKRMAEDLTEYLHEQGIRVRYMHSDIATIERIETIPDLRLDASA